MALEADGELRATIARGLERLNRDRGGRHLGRVAAALGVNRSSVSRWQRGEVVPSYERCIELAARYPDYFDRVVLAELHTRVALGDIVPTPPPAGASAGGTPTLALTLLDAYSAVLRLLEHEPENPAEREVLQTSMHLEFGTVDPLEHDPIVTAAERDVVDQVVGLMSVRARQGWRIRLVATAAGPGRLASLNYMMDVLEGPDVEIRAYPAEVPSVISPVVIQRRHVALAHDGLRSHRPSSALILSDPASVAWATRYFDDLFSEAPFRVRNQRGRDAAAMAEFEAAARRVNPTAWPT